MICWYLGINYSGFLEVAGGAFLKIFRFPVRLFFFIPVRLSDGGMVAFYAASEGQLGDKARIASKPKARILPAGWRFFVATTPVLVCRPTDLPSRCKRNTYRRQMLPSIKKWSAGKETETPKHNVLTYPDIDVSAWAC